MAEDKTEVIGVRFTPKQREYLQLQADANDMKLSEYLRHAVLRAARFNPSRVPVNRG